MMSAPMTPMIQNAPDSLVNVVSDSCLIITRGGCFDGPGIAAVRPGAPQVRARPRRSEAPAPGVTGTPGQALPRRTGKQQLREEQLGLAKAVF